MPVSRLQHSNAPRHLGGRICRLAVAATAAAKGLAALPIVTFEKAAKGLAALPIVTFEKGRARTPLRAGAGTANRQTRSTSADRQFANWQFASC